MFHQNRLSILFALFSHFIVSAAAQAQTVPATDDSTLGTVDLTGAASPNAIPLPKVAFVPLITKSDNDTLVQMIVRRDFELSGQVDLLDSKYFPDGPFLTDSPFDAKSWKDKGHEMVVRVFSSTVGGKQALLGELYVVATGKNTPAFSKSIELDGPYLVHKRRAFHRLADDLLGAVTGRPGGFSSQMTFTTRIGSGRMVNLMDSDGFNLSTYSSSSDYAISPAFGAKDDLVYALSRNYGPFTIKMGKQGEKAPFDVEGNVLGLAISSDRQKIAIAAMVEGRSRVLIGSTKGGDLKAISAAPMASQPAFGPLGKMAFVAGHPIQRVYVDGKAISPSGFIASSPTFCDSPKGLLVVYAVRIGQIHDLVASDTSGNGMFRLTQGQGSNTHPACSPDGRTIAFFSTRTTGKGPGLYVASLTHPSRAVRISPVLGESLRWESFAP